MRFPQQFPGKEDKVGIAASDDLVGMPRFRDKPDRAGFDSRFGPDATGKRHLIALAAGIRAFGIIPPEDTSIRSTPTSLSRWHRITDWSQRPVSSFVFCLLLWISAPREQEALSRGQRAGHVEG